MVNEATPATTGNRGGMTRHGGDAVALGCVTAGAGWDGWAAGLGLGEGAAGSSSGTSSGSPGPGAPLQPVVASRSSRAQAVHRAMLCALEARGYNSQAGARGSCGRP